MHLEETLQLSLDEKEDIIKALQTQVHEIFYFQITVDLCYAYMYFIFNSKLEGLWTTFRATLYLYVYLYI